MKIFHPWQQIGIEGNSSPVSPLFKKNKNKNKDDDDDDDDPVGWGYCRPFLRPIFFKKIK